MSADHVLVKDLEPYNPVPDGAVADLPVKDGVFQASRAAYHADRVRESFSKLEDFRLSPAYYHSRHVLGRPAEDSEAMSFGAAVHRAVLQPDLYLSAYDFPPERLDLRTKAGKEYAAAVAASGRGVIWPEEAARIAEMVVAVRGNKFAAALLDAPGVVEYPVQWLDRRTGTPLRCMFDRFGETPGWLVQSLGGNFILDLKTTSDRTPRDFERSCLRWGYHRQAALYRQGALHAVGAAGATVVLLVLPKYDRHAECWAAVLDPVSVGRGVMEVGVSLEWMAGCRERGVWPCHGSESLLTLWPAS